MKLQRLPDNWFSWKDYGITVLRRWDKYCQDEYSVMLSRLIDYVLEKVNEILRFVLCIPLLILACITVSYDLAMVSAKKVMGKL